MVENQRASTDTRAVEKRIETAAWGFLFIWLGVALVAHVGWGVGLVGVGVLTLAAQVARRWMGLSVERSSVAVGSSFIVGGVWNVLDVRLEIVPLLCIAAGVALVASAIRRTAHAPRAGVP